MYFNSYCLATTVDMWQVTTKEFKVFKRYKQHQTGHTASLKAVLKLTRILQNDLYSKKVRCSASSQESRWSNSRDIFLFLDMEGTR